MDKGNQTVRLNLGASLCGVALLTCSGVVTAAERVALVIGNDRYQRIAGLDNAGRDARAVAAKLRASPLGFTVIEGYDLDLAEMLDKLESFHQALSASGEVGLFYYAGHGAQISRGAGAEAGAENLLMPVDVSITTQSRLVAGSLRLSQVLAVMRNGGRDVNVVLLDACRDNPALDARGNRGLAPVPSESGFLIQFATAANRTAADGPVGSNGAYTGVLLEWLDRPGLSLDDVFTEVTGEVRRRTGQEPWRSSTLGRRVFLAGKSTLQRPVEGIPADQGEVRIEVSPAQAQVRIDGVLLGSGSRTIREPSGKTVLIRVEADGHEPAEERVRVQGGKVADVRLRLARVATAEVSLKNEENGLTPLEIIRAGVDRIQSKASLSDRLLEYEKIKEEVNLIESNDLEISLSQDVILNLLPVFREEDLVGNLCAQRISDRHEFSEMNFGRIGPPDILLDVMNLALALCGERPAERRRIPRDP